nr:CocE/NonD family hydrolase C-terminal non-catalytic domain-containing protein [Agromyces sp. H66]
MLYEVREAYDRGEVAAADAWPLPGVRYAPLYLDEGGTLAETAPEAESFVEYDGLASGIGAHRVLFEHTFTERTVLVGHATAELNVSAPDADDMDLFVGLFKRGTDGEVVGFAHYAQFEDGPVALGWLRVSHRELDDRRSEPFLPVLAHRQALPLESDGATRVTIEILPSGTAFEAGESLVLVVQGRDIMDYPQLVYARHRDAVNHGRQRVHLGGADPSRVVLPYLD